MNPEENKQPNQVDQPPQPEPNNQPIITFSPAPVVTQPVTIQTPDAATPPVAELSLPIQTPQANIQPATPTDTARKPIKPLVIASIAVVIIILVAGGLFAYSKIGSDNNLEVIDESYGVDSKLDLIEPDSSAPSTSESEATSQNTDTPTAPASSQALVLERDTERKNELKNAQQQLENYFNDNGEYPADWTVVIPDPDGRSGPNGDPYTYVVAADLQSYTLSANLENDGDPKADANGNYVIFSVNI